MKEGSKRASDFKYDARWNIARLVERGFLVRTVEGVDADVIRRMREEGLPNREIAEKLGISHTTLHYWIKRLNLEKRIRNPFIKWMNLRSSLSRLLKKNGPMSQKEVMKTLGLYSYQIKAVLIMFPEEFQKLNFTVKGRYSRRFRGLLKASPILTLKDDPRIIEYIASKINMKVQTPYEAKSIIHLLKYQIGKRWAHAIVEKLGYQYKSK